MRLTHWREECKRARRASRACRAQAKLLCTEAHDSEKPRFNEASSSHCRVMEFSLTNS